MGNFLILVGLAGLLFGLVNVVRPLGRLQVTTRKRGGAVLGSSLVVMMIGGGLAPPSEEPPVDAAPTTTTVASTTTIEVTSTTTTPPTTTTTSPIPMPDVPQADVLFAPPSAGSSGDPASVAPAGAEAATVTRITDGDTIDLRTDSGASDTIRLIGVNSPESDECFSEEAALVLATLIPVGTDLAVTVDTTNRDQFGRMLRYLWIGGMSVNEELVRRGAALSREYPPDTALAARFDAAEEEAQAAERGMWAPDACGPDAGTEITVVTVAADAPGDDNNDLNSEYVRVRNDGSLGVDMTGWVLKDESASHRYGFPAGFVLAAGAVVQIHTGCGTDTAQALFWCNEGAVWNNDGDTAFVQDHKGNIVHSLPFVPPTTTTTSTTTTTTVAPATTAAPESGGCHPSYTGACVPIVSDVDCAGGSGNGPEYVGRVNVVGPDDYDLDRDGDGVGCEDS
jgi:micrococcal nuclease